MPNKKILLYGATGFTANLMIEPLKKLDVELIVGGRNPRALSKIGEKHGLKHQVFSVEEPEKIVENLESIDLVLNCAGPFINTARPLVNAAIKTRTNYFDITGEIEVFEDLFLCDALAKENNIALVPGLGFDIAPSDCLAKELSEHLPHPFSLVLAIVPKNTKASHGTLKTMLLSKQHFVARREQGIKAYQGLSPTKDFIVLDQQYTCMRAPLPDLFCAHLSTGVTNIDTYLAIPSGFAAFAPLIPAMSRLTKLAIIQKLLKQILNYVPNGPSKEQQKQGFALIYGKVSDLNGQSKSLVCKTPEPYAFTAKLMTAATKSWLEKGLPAGFLTPSQAFGADFARKNSF